MALGGREERERGERQRGVADGRREQGREMAEQAPHAGRVVEIGAVAEVEGETGLARDRGERELELRGGAFSPERRQLQTGQVQLSRRRVL